MIHEKQLELFPFHKLYKQQRSCQLGLEESHHITFFLFSSSSFPLILPHPFTPSNISLFSNKEQFPCLYVFGTYHPLTMLNRAFPQTQHLFCPPHAHTSSIQTIWRDRMFKSGGGEGGGKEHSLEGTEKELFKEHHLFLKSYPNCATSFCLHFMAQCSIKPIPNSLI